MLREMQGSIASWKCVRDRSGAVLVFMLRTSQLFAKERGVYHKVYCLRKGDVAFFRDNDQLAEGSIREVNIVEVSFRGSKGDQGRKGAVLVRGQDLDWEEERKGRQWVCWWSFSECTMMGS